MLRMKKIFLSVLVTLLSILCISSIDEAKAVPVGAGRDSGHYFLGDQELSRFMVGVYYLDREREIITPNITSFQATKTMAYVGYEFLYGLSGFVTFGSTEIEAKGFDPRTRRFQSWQDTHSEYGFGLQFNILDHEIPDPTLMEDRIRVNATIQYTQSGADLSSEIDLEEIYGSITIAFLNDIEGNKYFHCDNVGFFFGAVYSDLKSSGIDETSAFGYCAGIDIRFSETVSFEFGVESLDDGAMFGAIHIGL